ncbi:hypothetical protein ACU4GD_21685 [Cupriavidus basilensis]
MAGWSCGADAWTVETRWRRLPASGPWLFCPRGTSELALNSVSAVAAQT